MLTTNRAKFTGDSFKPYIALKLFEDTSKPQIALKLFEDTFKPQIIIELSDRAQRRLVLSCIHAKLRKSNGLGF